jgi:hypothetical protein
MIDRCFDGCYITVGSFRGGRNHPATSTTNSALPVSLSSEVFRLGPLVCKHATSHAVHQRPVVFGWNVQRGSFKVSASNRARCTRQLPVHGQSMTNGSHTSGDQIKAESSNRQLIALPAAIAGVQGHVMTGAECSCLRTVSHPARAATVKSSEVS